MEKQNEVKVTVLNIHQKMALIKSELASIEIKKSGKNQHQKFDYLELKDFMPYILKLNAKYGINSVFNRNYEEAELILYDTESEKTLQFKMPYDYNGIGMLKGIQKDGGANTYLRRYMYITAYDLADNDTIDSADNSKVVEPQINNERNEMALELFKRELSDAKTEEEARKVYRKFNGKINVEDATKFGTARINELKAMAKELQNETINECLTVGVSASEATKQSEQKADDLKEVIEEKLETELIDVEAKDDKPIKGNKNAK